MFEIIQLTNDFESVIDLKETQAEAEDYVSALNDMKKNQETEFFYKPTNTTTDNESELF